MSNKITRPPIRYMGSKWRIAEWIMGYFPMHACYVEAFGGGGSAILKKAPAKFDVLNDINRDVINFFDVLRSQPDKLIQAIELTPYARAELRRAQSASDDPLEQARRFYIRCWQSFGSGTGISKSATGWRFQIGAGDNSRASAIRSWNDTVHLWQTVGRLKQIQIECDDAFKVIQRFDSCDTLFYLDPPYPHSTRYKNSKYKGYSVEMTDQDHCSLATLTQSLKGMVIISSYESELYDDLYSDWRKITRKTNDLQSGSQLECLWLSPSVIRQQPALIPWIAS